MDQPRLFAWIGALLLSSALAACTSSDRTVEPRDSEGDRESSNDEERAERDDENGAAVDASRPLGTPPKNDAGGSKTVEQPSEKAEVSGSHSGQTGPISKDCEGFPLEGLMHSPGGEVLPNKCEPFHATLNNPYAVRCVDAWPWYKTKYAGDEYCILPPPPDKGIQIGFHPQREAYYAQVSAKDMSGYENPSDEWLVKPGGEQTTSYRAPANNPEAHKYYRTYFRMRTGSHHNIISLHASSTAEGWLKTSGEALPGLFDPTAGTLTGVLGGQERPDDSTPVTLQRPPEDDGLYLSFPAKPSVFYNVHFFNTSKQAALKEGWVNIWWEETGSKLVSWFMGMELTQPLTLSVAPGATRDLHYAFAPRSTVRLVRFFGHRHVWTTNFSSWVERKSGDVEVIYQSFNWLDMPTYRYDSVVKNPKPSNERKLDGATSGILTLNAGDKLHFNCHIEYTEARAAEQNAPSPKKNGTLRFANQALTAEMCIGYGNVTGGSLGIVAADSSPIPAVVK